MRNYKKEAAYEDQPEQVKRRSTRNKARAIMEKKGLVHKGDGKEVDHKEFTKKATGSLNNATRNLRVVDRSTNRKKQPAHKGRNFR